MPTKNLIDTILSKARQFVLREMFLNSGKPIHLRELSRRTGLHPKTVQVEADNLSRVGVIHTEKSGNQKLYRINKNCPLYSELQMIILKTVGVGDEIRKALEPLKNRIHKAFIYGSFATGTYDSESDIDLMIVGDVSLREVVGATNNTAHMLRRVINAVTFTSDEYNQKLLEDGFIKRVENGDKIILIGDEDEPERLA
jgi:predicted nucleotidyltransferase